MRYNKKVKCFFIGVVFMSVPFLIFSQKNPSAIYGTWAGEVYENGELTGKIVMITQEAPGNAKVRFTVNFLDISGKETGTPTSIVGDYFYYDQYDHKHTAVIDWKIVRKSDKKKVKGGMYFGLLQKDGITYFTGTFAQKNIDEDYGAVVWKLTQLNTTANAQVENNGTDSKIIDYAAINDFHEGYAIVRKGERYGMIDASGNEFIPLGKYGLNMGTERSGASRDSYVSGFSNGMSVVKDVETEKYGYIDSTGKLVVPCNLSQAQNFQQDGYAHAGFTDYEKNLFFDYFFDKKGKRYAPKKLTGDSYSSPFVITQSPDGKTTIFTRKNGSKAFETKYKVNKYSDGMYAVTQFSDNNVVKNGYMDTTGKLAIPFKFSGRTFDFHEGFALYEPKFRDEYLYSFINKRGEEEILIKKENGIEKVFDFENGYANVSLSSRKKGMVDKTGKLIVFEDLFKQANPQLIKDLSTVWTTNFSFEYYSRNSFGILFKVDMALKPNSASAKLFTNKTERSTGGVGTSQKDYVVKGIGMMDYTGKIMILPQFESIGVFDTKSGLARATYRNLQTKLTKQGFINANGEFVLVLKNNIENF